jgi:Protein of unknown function (DUF2628)
MATYAVYARPDDPLNAVFVAENFSWGAFVFTTFWALWNRMWIVAVVLFALLAMSSALPIPLQFVFSTCLSFLLGFHGNDLLGWSLARRGYAEIGLATGGNLEAAELNFYSDFDFAEKAQVPIPLPGIAAHEPLGLFGARN